MKLIRLTQLVSTISLGLIVLGCGINPVTHQKELQLVSKKQEIALGEQHYDAGQQSNGGLYIQSPQITDYVASIGQKLSAKSARPELPFEFVILNDSVPNAWALPGGKIAINRGLLVELNNEAELAAVLAHEITHATARHSAKALERGLLLTTGTTVGAVVLTQKDTDHPNRTASLILGAQVANALIQQKFSRKVELEADHYGIITLSKAGYDPMAAVTLQKTFIRLSQEKQQNWLSGLFASHPPSHARAEANLALAKTLPTGGRLGITTYEKMISPLRKQQKAYDAYDQGMKHLSKKRGQAALEAAQEAIRYLPTEANFYILKAESEFMLGSNYRALKSLKKAEAYQSDYYYTYLLKGKVLDKTGNVYGAKIAYEKSMSLLPTEEANLALNPQSS